MIEPIKLKKLMAILLRGIIRGSSFGGISSRGVQSNSGLMNVSKVNLAIKKNKIT